MAKLQAAIIGCGGRGNEHAKGYAASDAVEIIAVVDPVAKAAEDLAEKYHVPHTYPSYYEMFAAHKPDIVSVCTWTGLHAEMVEASAASGVRAIHAEKPMAPTWGEAKAEHAACVAAGVQLTFCHQRRFGKEYVKARELAQSGAIGKILRLEGACSNLFDWGTHWFDMFFFYNNETLAESPGDGRDRDRRTPLGLRRAGGRQRSVVYSVRERRAGPADDRRLRTAAGATTALSAPTASLR